jgi:hypothetical protein
MWWDAPWPGRGRGLGDAVHRLHERHAVRRREDPDETWRCCERWPRTLIDKWNGREFAARHGCELPALYWRGPGSGAPLESLRDQFVIRPVMGMDRRGVYVVAGGRELLRDESATPEELRLRLSPPRRLARPVPVLIEEFVRSEDGGYELPLEYKCHTFGGTVPIIQLIEREGIHEAKHRWYTPAWEPIDDQMNVELPQAEVGDPPRCLDRMLELAARLGRELGTYMRIDFFATDRGCVFNEFSSVPGRGIGFTPYCELLLGAMWAELCPDRS